MQCSVLLSGAYESNGPGGGGGAIHKFKTNVSKNCPTCKQSLRICFTISLIISQRSWRFSHKWHTITDNCQSATPSTYSLQEAKPFTYFTSFNFQLLDKTSLFSYIISMADTSISTITSTYFFNVFKLNNSLLK